MDTALHIAIVVAILGVVAAGSARFAYSEGKQRGLCTFTPGVNHWAVFRVKEDDHWVHKGDYQTGKGVWVDLHREVINEAIRSRQIRHNGRYAVVYMAGHEKGERANAEDLADHSALYTLQVPDIPDTAVKLGVHDLPEPPPEVKSRKR